MVLARPALEIQQQPRLRRGDSQFAHAVVEGASHEPPGIRKEISDILVHIVPYNKEAYDMQDSCVQGSLL